MTTDPLISVSELMTRMGAANLRIVDGSFSMPGGRPTARENYDAAHIPGAVFFDIDAVADRGSTLPHMFPDEAGFAAGAGSLGLQPNDDIVVYDAGNFLASARVWWMLRSFGFAHARVLDGGLKAWRAAGGAVSDAVTAPSATSPEVRFDRRRVRSGHEIEANLAHPAEQLVDARSRERFEGTVDDPWPGRRRGHIPHSLNLPFGELIDPESGTLKGVDALRTALLAAGIDLTKPIVTTCGSGVSAAVINLALERLGIEGSALYDASWSEWGLPGARPVETGPSRR